MSKLCYPTVDLFIYDLRSPLNAQKENIDRNRSIFQGRLKDKLDSKVSQFSNLVFLIDTESRDLLLIRMILFASYPKFKKADEEDSSLGYQALLKPKNVLTLKTDKFEGYFYPVLLNDTYGLLVNCSLDEKNIPQPIKSSFQTIEQEISQYANYYQDLSIGKSQIISGWLSEEENNIEKVAEKCYKNLVAKPSSWSNMLYGKGKLLNSDIFEIWDPLSDYLDEHFLIILFPDQKTFDKAAEANYFQDWIRLFCYRHKIMWTYSQSRTIINILRNYYEKVDTISETIKKNSDKTNNLEQIQSRLQEIQAILYDFTSNLLKINISKETIEVNLYNYIKLTQIIKEKAGKNSDLSFLDKFSNLTETKYLKQIEKDEATMKLGLQLLESNINALRSQIELEKSERDRNFQDLIAIIGGGAAILTTLDFQGETCKRIVKSWPSTKNIFACDNFLFNSIIIPIFFIILLVILALSIKLIIKKIRL